MTKEPANQKWWVFKYAVLCPIKYDIVFIVEVPLCQKSRKN